MKLNLIMQDYFGAKDCKYGVFLATVLEVSERASVLGVTGRAAVLRVIVWVLVLGSLYSEVRSSKVGWCKPRGKYPLGHKNVIYLKTLARSIGCGSVHHFFCFLTLTISISFYSLTFSPEGLTFT